MKKNAFYAQSGGVTAVINASAAGVIEGVAETNEIDRVLAGKNGIIGALTEELIDTSTFSKTTIELLKSTPSGAFGSCRYKLGSFEKNPKEYERLIEVFEAHNVGYFFYNGGGDSADTCLKVSKISDNLGYPIKAIHIPKTVDNDLPITDCSPGFGSVAKYIATSTKEACHDVASMCKTSTKIFVLEVMGRHAGWIAAAGGLADEPSGNLPIVILFPEITFNEDKFLKKIENCIEKFGYCCVVVSEGLRSPDGRFLSEQGTTDAFGHAQLGGVAPLISNIISKKLGLKYHWAVSDYLQRSAGHIASKTDREHAYAVGREAVKFALEGKNSVMASIVRIRNDPYEWKISSVNLDEVANVEKKLSRNLISEDGFGITPACRNYLEPLISGESYPAYNNGTPKYLTIKNKLLKKRLLKDYLI